MNTTEMDLSKLREEIDSIDTELVRLLDRRAEIAQAVGKSKADIGMATFDAGRQKAVLLQAVTRSKGAFPREGLMFVFREVLSACLNLQKSLRVGYLGPAATYTHQASIREFGSSVEFSAYRLNRDVFRAVADGEVDFGVVPVENSTGGIVHDTLDSFIEYSDVRICSEVLLPIHHALMGQCSLQEVTKVYSHGQPFLQCARWLKTNLPNAELIEVGSTTQGIIESKKEPFGAAIASEFAAEKYDLRVIASRIEDIHDNTTRFLVLSRNDSRPSGDDKTSLMFGVKDQPGALLSVLKPFSEKGINLSKIESRPTRKKAWEQAFFVDAEGHHTLPRLIEVISDLEKVCETVRVLGSYPRDKSPMEIEEIQRAANTKK